MIHQNLMATTRKIEIRSIISRSLKRGKNPNLIKGQCGGKINKTHGRKEQKKADSNKTKKDHNACVSGLKAGT